MRFRKVAPAVWSDGTGSMVMGGQDASTPRQTRRADRVRAYLEAFFAGDLDRARPMVTPDFACQMTDLDGEPVMIVGFDAVSDFIRSRTERSGTTVMYELVEFLEGDDQVGVVFEEHPPLIASAEGAQLALWGFRGDLIASVRTFGAPRAPASLESSYADRRG